MTQVNLAADLDKMIGQLEVIFRDFARIKVSLKALYENLRVYENQLNLRISFHRSVVKKINPVTGISYSLPAYVCYVGRSYFTYYCFCSCT